MSTRVLDTDLPPDEQGTVGAQLDRGLGGPRFFLTAVQAAEMDGAGAAAHHDLRDLVGGCVVDRDARAAPRAEYRGEAIQAVGRVVAIPRIPGDEDLLVRTLLLD